MQDVLELDTFLSKIQVEIDRHVSNLCSLIPGIKREKLTDALMLDGFSLIKNLAAEKQLSSVATERHAFFYWLKILEGNKPNEIIRDWGLHSAIEKRDTFKESADLGFHPHLRSYSLIKEICPPNIPLKNIKTILLKIFFNLYSLLSLLGNNESYKVKSLLDVESRFDVPFTEPQESMEDEDEEEDASSSDCFGFSCDSSGTEPEKVIPLYPSEDLEEIIKEMDQLVGLQNVKDELRNLISYVKVNNLRRQKGLKSIDVSLHCVFMGPPGTGKTTFARIIGRAYKTLGILKKGHVIETDRSQLIAGYLGQTALKTREVLNKSLDGVLFIDEAYSLSSRDDQYGKECIETILKFMEDHRDRFVLIAAGYEQEMSTFLESNPGFSSRFNKYFNFPNYSQDELMLILASAFKSHGFELEEKAIPLFKQQIIDGIRSEGTKFGNARFVRNLCESTIQNQFKRVARIKEPTTSELTWIYASDVAIKRGLQ